MIAVFQAATYFITIPQKDDNNLTPLTFKGRGLGAELQKEGEKYSSTVKLDQIIGQLKSAVEENIRQGY